MQTKGKLMVSGTSLLSQIPLPSQNQKTQMQPAVASVKVGDVEIEGSGSYPTSQNPSLPLPEAKGFFEKLKNKFIQYRMNKIAQKSPEQRTETEQAEYEANQQSLNSVI